MSHAFHDIQPGLKISHPELGDGVVVGNEPTGYVTVFFRAQGERQVPADSLLPAADRFDQILQTMVPVTEDMLEQLWLAVEAEELPLMESAATLSRSGFSDKLRLAFLIPHRDVKIIGASSLISRVEK